MAGTCLLEVAANSVTSALTAQEGGAGRVELCTALELGGVTPSFAQIAMAREHLSIPLYVLIRPRGGDFVYSDRECELMLRDIETCVELGCDGVVLGVLDAEGKVDMVRCRELVAAARGLGVTFHRAFDVSLDPLQTLEDVIALGCERVLTSGTRDSAVDGASLIHTLIAQAAGRLTVMPGAGITAQNIAGLAQATGAREFHASAKHSLPSRMQQHRQALSGLDGSELCTDLVQVREIVAALRGC
ncbi:MAG: copper homeostasis protein CutC [Rhodanobacter sp.]